MTYGLNIKVFYLMPPNIEQLHQKRKRVKIMFFNNNMFLNNKPISYYAKNHSKNFFTPFCLFLIPLLSFIACASSGGIRANNKLAEEILNKYIIQPGDTLLIDILENTNTSRTIPVRPDGKITLPQINDIQAAGLTPLQLRENLLNEYKLFYNVVEISVTVTNITGYKITIVGRVHRPGQITLPDKTTFLEAIAIAGGLQDWAKSKKIYIIREIAGNHKKINLNYNKILDSTEENIWVLPGDIIVVP